MACLDLSAPGSCAAYGLFDHSGRTINHGLYGENPDGHLAQLAADQAKLAQLLAESGAFLRVFRGGFENFLCAADTMRAEGKSPDVESVERHDVAAPSVVQEIFFRYGAILEKDWHSGAALDAHLLFFRAYGEIRDSPSRR